MSDDLNLNLKNRMMLWHKGLCQLTGAMSLSFFGSGLQKAVIQEWADRAHIIAADMQALVDGQPSKLDKAGRAELDYVAQAAATAKRPERGTPKPPVGPTEETSHEVANPSSAKKCDHATSSRASSQQGAGPKSTGRKATRKSK